MGRIATLVGKELWQHAVVGLGLLFTLPVVYFLLIVGVHQSPMTITDLMAHTYFLWVFLPLTGIVLGNRLVVSEFQGRTQLFVEALPVRRLEMVAVKYVLGLFILLGVSGLSLVASAIVASRTEPIGAGFLGIMTLRTWTFAFCVWSLLFAMGLLGRFRVPLYIAMVLLLAALDALTELDVWRFGPFALVDERLVLERESVPVTDLLVTSVIGALWCIVALVLTMLNEGSLTESLARRMTLKEKSVTGAIFLAATMAITALEERRQKEPFSFQGQAVVSSNDAPIEILYRTDAARADAEALLEVLESDLTELRDEMGWPQLPPVRVSLWSSLEGGVYRPVELTENEGVLLRANFRGGPGWDERGFRAVVVEETLDAVTAGRASFEPRAWFKEGFARLWVERRRLEQRERRIADCPPMLRAIWARRALGPLSVESFRHWWRWRESHGDDIARGTAFSAAALLAERHGLDAVAALAREMYGRPVALDTREVIRERLHPFPRLFRESIGAPWDAFIDDLNAALDELGRRPEVAAVLDQVPEATAKITIERGPGAIRNIHLQVRLSRAPEPSGRVTFIHAALSPFDDLLNVEELQRSDREATTAVVEHRLAGLFGPGARVFLAVDVESEALGCPIRLLAQRREVR